MVFGSIYGAARTAVSEGTFNPDYATPTAALDMVTEGLEIDQKFFNLFVEHDFLEAGAADDAKLESTLMAVDESFLSDVWQKIRDFLKKIKDKIVSIFKAAAVKIGAFFKRDNEGLVSKYESQFKAADKSNITIKGYRKCKGSPIKDEFDPTGSVTSLFDEIKVGTAWTGGDRKSEIRRLEKIEKDSSLVKVLKSCMKNTSCVSDSGKIDIMKFFAEPKDVKANEIADDIKKYLVNYASDISDIKELETELVDEINKLDQSAKEEQDKLINGIDGEDGSDDKRQVETKKASVAKSVCSAYNGCVGKLASATIDVLKFKMKQSRAAYIKIASAGAPHAKNESAELLEAVLDADAYEVDSFFDQYSYDYDELTA